MKVTATELMKQLKFITEEISDVHRTDGEKSKVLMKKENDNTLVPAYSLEYDFLNNRKRINELFKEERRIKNILSKFNCNTLVQGFDFSINEGLIRIGELKDEIRILSILAKKNEYSSSISSNNDVSIFKVTYNIEDAKNALRSAQRELSALQVAIDKTNLNSEIEIDY